MCSFVSGCSNVPSSPTSEKHSGMHRSERIQPLPSKTDSVEYDDM